MTLTVVAILTTASPPLRQLFIDRAGSVVDGQWWRLLTGHLAHGGDHHLLLNLILFIPLGALRERDAGTRRFLCELTFLALTVAVGIRLFHPDWTTYQGLSGIVYGLLAVALLAGNTEPTSSQWLLVIFLVVKSGLELLCGCWLLAGDSLCRSLEVTYLPGSHCAGLFGAFFILLPTQREPDDGIATTGCPSGWGKISS